MNKLLPLIGVLATAGFLAYTNWPLPQPERLLYSVVDLGEGCRPITINNRGEILLRTEREEAVRLPDGAMVPIRIDSAVPYDLVSMNDAGQVLGRTSTGGEEEKAFIWNRSEGVRFIPEEVQLEQGGTAKIVSVHSLTNDGKIGVTVRNETGHHRGILNPDGWVLPISSRSTPRLTPGGALLLRRNLLWSDGRSEELPRGITRYRTPTQGAEFVIYPTGLNDEGCVIGFAFPSDIDYRRMRGRMRERPETTRGDPPPELPETGFPFLRLDNVYLNLNLCIPPGSSWNLRWPSDVNNQEQVIGYGLKGDAPSGFLLEPIEGEIG
ncbi:MAG: hypothetical protein H6751_02080 [Candidatus Omnitrophica bacterium]|nr:hypothetical protein [Candidatus Omnitrophota bacterium]